MNCILSTIRNDFHDTEIVELAPAILAGIAGGASFGPINMMVLNLYLRSQRLNGVVFSAGALVGDVLIVVTNATLLSLLEQVGLLGPVILGGSLLLIVLGLRSAFHRGDVEQEAEPGISRTAILMSWFTTAVFLTYFSPFGFLVWGALTAASTASSLQLMGVVGMVLGNVLWYLSYNTVLWRTARLISKRVRRFVTLGTATAMVGIGAMGIYRVFS